MTREWLALVSDRSGEYGMGQAIDPRHDMDFAAARVKMVDNQIRTTDVTSHETLRALPERASRGLRAAGAQGACLLIDSDIPVGHGRFLISPSPLAKMIQLAEIGTQDVVLDVGCATGYSSAVLAHLAVRSWRSRRTPSSLRKPAPPSIRSASSTPRS